MRIRFIAACAVTLIVAVSLQGDEPAMLRFDVDPGWEGFRNRLVPEPLPLTERAPWLIYIVLAASSIALGFVLFSLARTATRVGTQP